MPVKRKKAEQSSHPELVQELVRVFKSDKEQGPPDEPEITIEEVPHSNDLHLWVIWDKWSGVNLEERGGVILDAFAQAYGEAEMLRVTMVLGLTRQEDQRFLRVVSS